jgi:hypothetical protein
VETGFKATIAEAGEYTLTVELINAKTYATIDEAGVKTFTVEAPPLAELVVTDAVHDADNKTIAYTFNAEFKLVREFDKPWEIRASELSDANAGLFQIYLLDEGYNYDYPASVRGEVKGVAWDEATNTITLTYEGYLEPGTYLVDTWGYTIANLDGVAIDKENLEKALFTVEAPVAPEVVFEFNGFEDFVAGEENSFSVKVTATGIDDSTALKYKATFKKGDTPVANQEIWYEEGAQGNWKTFKTDENGVAYFGPKDGFTMADLDLSEGVETGFKATIAEAGEYTLTVELINAKTYATIDEAGVQLVANFAAVELDLSPIDVAIAAAEAAKEGVVVSEDGADVPAGTYWVTQEDMDALEAAIAMAEAAVETAETQQDVVEAVEALEGAIAAFNDAKREAIDKNATDATDVTEGIISDQTPECDGDPGAE